jgi:hypothetical protein
MWQFVDQGEEFKVHQIVGVQQYRKGKQWQYLIKLKGYPDSKNTWELLTHLKHTQDLLTEWHKKNLKQPKPSALVVKLSQLNSNIQKKLHTHVERRFAPSKPCGQTIQDPRTSYPTGHEEKAQQEAIKEG